jgi:hypothetical protein
MKRLKLEAGQFAIFIYEDTDEDSLLLLNEAKHRGIPLGGPYSVEKHSPHTPKNDYHLHLYHKNNQILAINRDGTAHDRSHGCIIPMVAADALRKMFLEYSIPETNLIESAGVVEYLLNL